MQSHSVPSVPQVFIPESELAPFVSGSSEVNKAQGLLRQQMGAWEMLRNGYATLQTVRTRVFDFDGFQIKVQFNAGRMTSTVAKVDATSIKERKCFLCPANLPPVQRGLPCDGEYVVLCNPFPIFPEHFTIPTLNHVPQRILGSFSTLLKLTQGLGERYTVFYNGPKCGASAPDHLHFQAGNRAFLPIDAEYDVLKARGGAPLHQAGNLRVYAIDSCLRSFFALESSDAAALQRAFGKLHEALQAGVAEAEEPLMNILSFWQNGTWRVVIFPRAKHRPAFYFAEGEDKLLISPAAVELGGICTTPREQDFGKVTREHLVQMYQEVCVSPEKFQDLKARLASALAA
jgi:hypothetical protein